MQLSSDSLGRLIPVPTNPQRIVSLCPSQTETLWALGAAHRLVGRTRYCIQPQGVIEFVAVVGGTKKVDFQAVAQLKPDLIIAEKEENTLQDVEGLSKIAPVYVTKNESFEESLETISRLGALIQAEAAAHALTTAITSAWAQVRPVEQPLKVLYLIWPKPLMTVGRTTFIGAILERLGLENLGAQLTGRYPILENPQALRPDVVLLSTEPYPFKPVHIPSFQQIWPTAHVKVVRGDYFAWYGARQLEAAPYFASLAAELSAMG